MGQCMTNTSKILKVQLNNPSEDLPMMTTSPTYINKLMTTSFLMRMHPMMTMSPTYMNE